MNGEKHAEFADGRCQQRYRGSSLAYSAETVVFNAFRASNDEIAAMTRDVRIIEPQNDVEVAT